MTALAELTRVPSATKIAWAATVRAELERRVKLLERLTASEQARRVVMQFLSRDHPDALIAFARDFVTTTDPRNKSPLPKDMPFVLWPKQEELLRELWSAERNGRNLVVEKSRDTGVTVTALGVYYVWRWLFFPNWTGGVGSRKQGLLDSKDDPKTAFAKVRQTLYNLPKWMLPAGFSRRKHDNFARIVNPANKSAIIGEAGENQGRGARTSMYVLDEFGTMARPAAVEAAVSGATDCVVYISTATPVGTYFHNLVTSKRARVFRFHWTDDPRKDAEWYQQIRLDYGPVITALEYDIDYTGGANDTFIPPHWLVAAVDADFGHSLENHPIVAGFDVAGGGDNEHCLVIRRGPMVQIVRAWTGDDPTTAAQVVASACAREGVSRVYYDMVGVGAGVGVTMKQQLAGTGKVIHIGGVNSGDSPDAGYLPDNSQATCKERFANLKAQLWWEVRRRFENTYLREIEGAEIDASECISIPNDSTLISQLCSPKQVLSANGRLAVEPKERMRKRGAVSPDRADALVLAFAEPVERGNAVVIATPTTTIQQRHQQNVNRLHQSTTARQRGF